MRKPTLHHVWVFSHMAEDFECIGAFSNREEADTLLIEARAEHAAALPNPNAYALAGAVISSTFPEFQERVFRNRLGGLIDALELIFPQIKGVRFVPEDTVDSVQSQPTTTN